MTSSRFFSVVITLFLVGSIPASAESKNNAPAANDCSGAWTGVVTYTRTQSQSDNKTVERVSGRGKDTRNWQMTVNYKATVGVSDDPEKKGSSRAKATISHSFSSKETNTAVEKNSCDRGKTWQEMTGTFTSESSITGNGKVDANVYIGLNSDGTYSIGVALPEINGTLSGSESSTFSGQCTPKKGQNRTMGPIATTIPGNSLSSDTEHMDPNEPNRLSGSYSLTLPGGVVETMTWNLQKCGAPLRIIDLKFEDMKYPKWDDWQEIVEQNGTVDGNWVKIKATVFNSSTETKTGEVYLKETYKGDKWDGARPDKPLKNQSFTVTLNGGEDREVELLWDSSGYAWFDDGRPRLVQRIKAEVWENFKKTDEMTKNLKVLPKPIVFVPGIWTKPTDFEVYQNILTTAHSYGWKALAVVDTSSWNKVNQEAAAKPAPANRSVYDNADNLNTYVNGVRSQLNAWHVDLLGHGTGGLAARLYVHKQMEVLPDNHPVVKHLLLVGTPNNGVPCPESDSTPDQLQTAKELAPEEITRFNQYVTQRKGTMFSALVGNQMPILCLRPQWNDGHVPVDSAKFGIDDVTVVSDLHSDLLNTQHYTDYVRPHVVVGPEGTYPFAKAPSQ